MRIGFFAGACAGKTTTAAWLFSELKYLGYSVEQATEYVKKWTYIDRKPRSFDQIYIFGKQLAAEDLALSAGVEHVVTDSPIHLSHIYANFYGDRVVGRHLLSLTERVDKIRPTIAIYLDRGNKPYKQEGRWGSLEDAKKIDEAVQAFLERKEKKGEMVVFRTNYLKKNRPALVQFVKKFL